MVHTPLRLGFAEATATVGGGRGTVAVNIRRPTPQLEPGERHQPHPEAGLPAISRHRASPTTSSSRHRDAVLRVIVRLSNPSSDTDRRLHACRAAGQVRGGSADDPLTDDSTTDAQPTTAQDIDIPRGR
jgi:hypothetical protein